MKKLLSLTCPLFVLTLFLSACENRQKDTLYHIGIVQITEAPLLDDARQGVIDSLKEEGFIDGTSIRITYKNGQGDMSSIPLIIKDFVSRRVDMIITDSTPCMVAAAQIVKDIPVVFTVAFSPQQLDMKDTPKNLTGVYDPMAMGDLIQLIKKCIPGIKKIGIPYNPSEQNAVLAAKQVREECRQSGIELVEMNVFSSNEVLQNVEVLAQKKIDAMVVSADNTLSTGMAAVVKIAARKKIPLFVTEPGEVERGACAGIGADFYEWGRQSGKIAAQIIRGRRPEEIPVQPIIAKVLYINVTAAQAQGITFPDDVIKKAAKVVH